VRLALKCANPAEWLALRAGLVPGPAAEAWGGMTLSGVVVAAVRSGVTARLACGQATAPKVAADLGLDPLPAQLLLDCLRSGGYVAERSGRYRLTRRGRRWLDPASRQSVAAYVEGAGDHWSWWAGLPDTMRTGMSSGSHEARPGQIADLFRRARKALNPGGTFAVLDVFADHGRRPRAHADMLALFVYLSSGAQVHTPAEMAGWLRHAGFAAPRKIRLLRMPGLTLQVARNPG
jgi:hypothetical protein